MNTVELVIFSCGCIGSKPDADGNACILSACDSDDGGHGMRNRPMQHKDHKPVDPGYIEVIWQKYVQAENGARMARAMRVLVAGAEITR